MISQTKIAHPLQANAEPEAACHGLVGAAKTTGGNDIITPHLVNCG